MVKDILRVARHHWFALYVAYSYAQVTYPQQNEDV